MTPEQIREELLDVKEKVGEVKAELEGMPRLLMTRSFDFDDSICGTFLTAQNLGFVVLLDMVAESDKVVLRIWAKRTADV